MYKTCVFCGSDKIIADASVEDGRTTGYSSLEHVVRIAGNPKALIFNKIVESRLRAYICGNCGYTVLFATNPHELYEAYQSYLDKK